VVILHVPLGNYLARVYTASTSWRVEKAIYRVVGVQPDNEQRWTKYLTSLLAFSWVSVLLLYAILLGQAHLPEPWGHKGMTPALAFNTAISFTTNTSWQNYPVNPLSRFSGWPPAWACRRLQVAPSGCAWPLP
jgi:K+-transporting ATPase ATPase A chain